MASAAAVTARGGACRSSITRRRPVYVVRAADAGAAGASAASRTAVSASRRMGGALVPERELRVLGHPLRGPRWGEGHRRLNTVDALEFRHELVDLLGYLRPDRASGRRQRERHVHVPAVDLDAIDQPQF